MNTRNQAVPFLVAAAVLTSSLAHAAQVDLRAARFPKTMPDGKVVEMWGFGLLTDATVSAPGPVLRVPPGDSSLTITLRNDLDVAISIVLPGQAATMAPVWDDGSSGPRPGPRARAVAFAHQTAPGDTGVYSWNNLRPGTYLYHSGSHLAVQVQMGLYGGLIVDQGPSEAYAGLGYDSEQLLLLSEIDPALHDAVADGSYGTPAFPSTVRYAPRYFLINGEGYPAAGAINPDALAPPPRAGDRVLLRALNAGLETHTLLVQGSYLQLVAEDGQPYRYPREQYSLLLAAGKTLDAVMVPAAAGRLAVFDRNLRLGDGAQGPGGMLLHLDVEAAPAAPVASADSYILDEDTTLDLAIAGLPGVLANDSGNNLQAVLVDAPHAGQLTLGADGLFVYTPLADFSGADHFGYRASDGVLSSAVTRVELQVQPVNDVPFAAADDVQGVQGQMLGVLAPGVLGNDLDVDGDPLTAVLVSPPSGGTLSLAADGSFIYLPTAGTSVDAFSYLASDGLLDSAVVTVAIALVADVNASPVAVSDTVSTRRNTSLNILVLANDSDPDGVLDLTSVQLVTAPNLGGAALVQADGSVRYTPSRNFRGTETFSYRVADTDGAWSNVADIRVNVR